MSFSPLIKVLGDPKYYPNSLVFETKEEAEDYIRHKIATWTLAEAGQVEENDKTPNYTFRNGKLRSSNGPSD